MKKKILYYMLATLALYLPVSCNTLDIENISDYDAEKVWNDEKLVNAYMANLYAGIFGNWSVDADQKSQQLTGIHFYDNRVTVTNSEYKRWDYTTIRLINEAIENTQNGNLSDDIKEGVIGQALFLRAYMYFRMVYYHGGVPYLTKPQDKDKDDLYVYRNSTKECFEYIVRDLDEAIRLLPRKNESSSGNYGKVDASFALAFKAKVLLYKASPQFNPGNPWDNSYWQEAYAVNAEAYTTLKDRGYALTADYSDIFLVERGPEVVFAVINSYPNKTASWDHGVRPGSESRDNARACPTWEFVKEFPMKDGKLYNDPTGNYFVPDDVFLQSYWENRDPRFEKSVVWNAAVYEVSRKTNNRQYTSLGIAHELDDFGVNPKANINSTNLNRYSGFFILKASDLSLLQSETQQYNIDYIVMRFAEVMLNYAETANETGRHEEAIHILKAIRERAGIEPGADGLYGLYVSNREEIRKAILAERNIEFCFEGMRFWDLRRLRMLDRLDKQTKHGVEAIAIHPDGSEISIATAKEKAGLNELTEKDFYYQVWQIPFTGVQVTSVPDRYYFFPIQQSAIDRNSNLQ